MRSRTHPSTTYYTIYTQLLAVDCFCFQDPFYLFVLHLEMLLHSRSVHRSFQHSADS